MKIGTQIGLLLAALLAAGLGGLGGFAHHSAREFLVQDAERHMENLAETHEAALEELLHGFAQQARLITSRTRLRELLASGEAATDPAVQAQVRRILADATLDDGPCGIEVRDRRGELVATTVPGGRPIPLADPAAGRDRGTRVIGMVRLAAGAQCVAVASPLSRGGEPLGRAVVLMPEDRLIALFRDTTVGFRSGEILLARRGRNGDAVFLIPLRHGSGTGAARRIPASRTDVPVTHALARREALLNGPHIVDYRGQPVIAATRYLEQLDWGIVAKVDRQELLAPVTRLRNLLLVAGGLIVVALALASLLLARRITGPLQRLERTAVAVASGNLAARAEVNGAREVRAVAAAFNAMLRRLEQARNGLEQAVRESRGHQAFIETLADSLPVGIFAADEAGRYVLVNRTLEQWYARPREQILGRTPGELLGGSMGPASARLLERALAGEAAVEERLVTYPDGVERRVQTTIVPGRQADGRAEGFFCLLDDVTTEREAERKLRHAHKMEALGLLTGGVAHDFNNLLTTIIGNLDIVGHRAELEEADGHKLEVALGAARRGAELTRKLLGITRMDNLNPEAVDLGELLEDGRGLYRRTLREDIVLTLDHGTGVPAAWVDRQELEHALLNLVINASDAMAKGGNLTIESRSLEVKGRELRRYVDLEPGLYATLAVTDDGIGIPRDALEKVFDPFFTTKAKEKGSGLGLSMVYSFARQSGGDVVIHSEAGVGTTVRLYLPAPGTAAAASAPAMAAAADDDPGPADGETVLVVEDDPEVRELAVDMLEGLGYRVLAAADGPEALEVLEGGDTVDAVVTDVIMPGGMSGADVAAAVQARWPHIGVMFVSGYAEDLLTKNQRISGDVPLLQKPYDQLALGRMVRRVLRGH